jgi:superfamily II DNA helicase RecQ
MAQAAMSTTGKQKKPQKRGKPQTDDELGGLMQKTFGWSGPPRKFQLEATKALLSKKDVLVHAGTGFGKTAVAAGPHVVEKEKTTLMVSPLIALHEEQVRTQPSLIYITNVDEAPHAG